MRLLARLPGPLFTLCLIFFLVFGLVFFGYYTPTWFGPNGTVGPEVKDSWYWGIWHGVNMPANFVWAYFGDGVIITPDAGKLYKVLYALSAGTTIRTVLGYIWGGLVGLFTSDQPSEEKLKKKLQNEEKDRERTLREQEELEARRAAVWANMPKPNPAPAEEAPLPKLD